MKEKNTKELLKEARHGKIDVSEAISNFPEPKKCESKIIKEDLD